MAVIDHVFPDSPTNVFATMNPLDVSSSVLSDGNLTIDTPLASTNNLFSTISFPNEGKWFFEILYISYQHHYSGIFNKTTGDIYQIYQQSFYTNGASPVTLSTNSYSAGSNSVIGLLINFENVQATVTIYINGTSVGGPYNITSGEYFASFNDGASATGGTQIVNFGQNHLFGGATLPSGAGSNTPDNGIGTFAFSVPSGAKALCTANLPDPVIDPALDNLPEDYFKAVKYTGQTTVDAGTWDNGTSTSTIAVGFQADLLWIKGRNYAEHHSLFDSVRGFTNILQSNRTNGESPTTQHVQSVGSTDFTIGTNHEVNNANSTFVAWCFRAGGAPTTDNISNSGNPGQTPTAGSVKVDGQNLSGSLASASIYPTRMSVNTEAGFSIVKYNGTGTSDDVVYSIPHGLSSAPDMVIVKNLDLGSQSAGISWPVLFKNIGGIQGLDGTTTASSAEVTNNWGGAYPTANVFTVKRPTVSSLTNRYRTMGAYNYIAYCWHSVPGYSAFGSYTGNGSADGPFVYTGFKPAWVMVKRVNAAESWTIFDNARDPYNLVVNRLHPNSSDAETTGSATAGNICLDFYSNSFKMRNTSANINGSELYIFAAFAEQPFKYAATNAR